MLSRIKMAAVRVDKSTLVLRLTRRLLSMAYLRPLLFIVKSLPLNKFHWVGNILIRYLD